MLYFAPMTKEVLFSEFAKYLEEISSPRQGGFGSTDYDDFKKDFSDFLDNQNQKSLTKLILTYIDNKKLKDSDVYNKVGISRQQFNQFKNKGYISKRTLLALCLSLELTEEETIEALHFGGFNFNTNNNYDNILKFCIIKSQYNIPFIDELLISYNQKPLCCAK